MYKVIREKGFKDLQDVSQHIYVKGNEFPFDNREIKESRFLELSTNLNKLNEPIIQLESDLSNLSKKDIQQRLIEENIAFEKATSKENLIIEYEYQKSRVKLLEEAEQLEIEITEEMPNIEIVELILKNQNN